MVWMPVENPDWKASDLWPPTDASPYDSEVKRVGKPGNFFTLRDEDHPAYDLFRALVAQGWTWDAGGGRHWVKMRKGYAYASFSLFGQGHFGSENERGVYGIGFEDADGTWSLALPALTAFMQAMALDGGE